MCGFPLQTKCLNAALHTFCFVCPFPFRFHPPCIHLYSRTWIEVGHGLSRTVWSVRLLGMGASLCKGEEGDREIRFTICVRSIPPEDDWKGHCVLSLYRGGTWGQGSDLVMICSFLFLFSQFSLAKWGKNGLNEFHLNAIKDVTEWCFLCSLPGLAPLLPVAHVS